MELRRLGYFLQVAELGSLTRASERLNIAQPSLSRQMRLLEKELGVTLFARQRRGMELTEAGAALHARITGPLRQIGHAFYEVRSLEAPLGGAVVFGMPPTIVPILAGLLARDVATSMENVALQIVEASNGHLLDRIRKGELDAAILYGPTPVGLNASKLLEDELVLVGPASTLSAAGGAVDFHELGNLPLILPGSQQGIRTAVDAAAEVAGIKLVAHLRADSFSLMKELARAGLGYTLLPYHAVAREVADGDLGFSMVRNPPIARHLFLALPSGAKAPRAVLQTEGFVRRAVAELVRTGRWPYARSLELVDP